MLIAGDIGGTKTVLCIVEVQDGHREIVYEKTYPSQSFTDLVPIVKVFLETANIEYKETIYIEKACFGIAGPVVGNSSQVTNLKWNLTSDRLQDELNFKEVKLINDFAAVGYGILGLSREGLHHLQTGQFNPEAPIAVLGAGTGLGQGFLIPSGKGKYTVFPSEGSHADFGPRSELEFQLLQYLQKYYGINRVSVERVVSGMGIVDIYHFLRTLYPKEARQSLKDCYAAWERGESVDLAAVISHQAMEGDDRLSQQTMEIFIKAYGAEAGNLALKLLPYGGLYVAGGIAPKILSLLDSGEFMTSFKDKGRLREVLERIPVNVVVNPKVGLIGAALRLS